MASRFKHHGRVRTLLCSFMLAASALPTTSVLARGQDSPAMEDLCPYLGGIRRVSYKRQEPKLFRDVVQQIGVSPVSVPPVRDVFRTFEACQRRLQARTERDGAGPESSTHGTGAEPTPRIRFDVTGDGTRLEVTCGDSPPHRYKLRGEFAGLVRRIMRDILDPVDPRRRKELENELWFVWIESYIRATGEKYNSYDYAQDLIEERATDRGKSFAVGFEVTTHEGRLQVSDIYDERLRTAGLVRGDVVVRLDDRVPGEMTVPELQYYWLNPEPFSFTVRTQRRHQQFQVSGHSVPTRHSTLAWTVRGELGYVRIRGFNRGSLIELRRARRALESRHIRRLIVDLRGNPGGTLSTGLVDVFLKPGQTAVSYRDHRAREAADVDSSVEFWGTPTALLVDRNTASMAEILAAAFRAHQRGPVVGETTFGKGVGQSLYPVLDEGRLNLVERTYYFPGSRKTWNEIGIAPTLEIEIGDEEREILQTYLDSRVLRLDEQWTVDPVLRAADRQMKEQP